MKTRSALTTSLTLKALLCALAFGFVFLLATAAPADNLVLKLDDPFQVTLAPSTGVTVLQYTGSIGLPLGYSLGGISLDNPKTDSGSILQAHFVPSFLSFFTSGASTYTGTFFDVTVPTGALPGLYDLGNSGVAPAAFTLLMTNQVSTLKIHLRFSTTVMAVPEAGSSLLFGFGGAIIGLGAIWARRSRSRVA